MKVLEKIYAFGHENILCTHNKTIEITKDNYLTVKGNCILGINASMACKDLNSKLKSQIRKGKKFKISIRSGEIFDFFLGYGDDKLTLLSDKDMVFRKSNFICDRTVLINCNKSSNELHRDLIKEIKNYGKRIVITIEVIS